MTAPLVDQWIFLIGWKSAEKVMQLSSHLKEVTPHASPHVSISNSASSEQENANDSTEAN